MTKKSVLIVALITLLICMIANNRLNAIANECDTEFGRTCSIYELEGMRK